MKKKRECMGEIESDDSGFDIDLSTLQPTEWIMDDQYVRGSVSLLVGEPAVGKSMLALLDAVSVATGRNLSGHNVVEPGNVWVHNDDDGLDEVKRRFIAITTEHGIDHTKMPHKIFMTSNKNFPIDLSKKDCTDKIIKMITDNNIGLLILDPLLRLLSMSSAHIDQSEISQMAKVMNCIEQIANETNCAICLVYAITAGFYDPWYGGREGLHSRIVHHLVPVDENLSYDWESSGYDRMTRELQYMDVDGNLSYVCRAEEVKRICCKNKVRWAAKRETIHYLKKGIDIPNVGNGGMLEVVNKCS